MKRLPPTLLAVAFLVLAAPVTQAESVEVVPSPASLQSGGGVLSLDLAIDYKGTPAAMGLALALPDGWSLVSVSGANVPQIVSPPGTTESVECAWTSSPADGAVLQLKVAYPAGAAASDLVGSVQLRQAGRVADLPVRVTLGR